jgi:predicted transposase YdaD
LPSDHWYSEVFRAMPDLVCRLLPGLVGEPEQESNYIFRPVALKKVAHHPDGVLWPRQHPGGSDVYPVVLLEVQMHADRRFHRRLGAETFRLLQQHEEVAHLQVLVLLAHRRLALGSSQPLLLKRFLEQDVTWVDLQALACQPDLDPMLALLTLPVQKEPDLGPCAQRIVALRPDLIELIVPILSERFQGLTPSQIMATLGISKDFWRHTRAFQDILAEGRQEGVELGRKEGVELGRQEGLQVGLQEGRQEGHQEGRELGLEEGLEEGRRREACTLALRLLERRCGTLSAATNSGIEVLSRAQLENLTLALLDFRSVEDLQIWLEQLEA